jgi:DNA-binding transcriptional LysR family regulator
LAAAWEEDVHGTLGAVEVKTELQRSLNETMMAPDLNDYALFAEVVTHRGFAAAGRAMRVPKSTLSRRIGSLEARLGVRLIERSTRRFRVTDIGQAFYERCRMIMMDVQQANAIVSEALGEPRGVVRCSCPLGMVEVLSPIFCSFMQTFPKANLQVVAIDRAVGLIDERIDVAIRVRATLETDAALTMRSLGRSTRILVSAPALVASCAGGDVAALSDLPTLATTDQMGEITWAFSGPDGAQRTVRHEPRLTCVDFLALRDAAVAGLGVALLPEHTCRSELAKGSLVHVFPQWDTEDGIVHLVFTTRRGLPPVVRAFIDHLAGTFRLGRS